MNASGSFTYDFTKVAPIWSNSLKTGFSQALIDLTCQFSGYDSQGSPVVNRHTAKGRHIFSPEITRDYFAENMSEIINTYASGEDWWARLETRLSDALDAPIPDDSFREVMSSADIRPEVPSERKIKEVSFETLRTREKAAILEKERAALLREELPPREERPLREGP